MTAALIAVAASILFPCAILALVERHLDRAASDHALDDSADHGSIASQGWDDLARFHASLNITEGKPNHGA